MHYYLCRFGDPGWPAGGEDLPEWTSIELEPSGYTVLASPKRYDGLWRYYLGDDALNPSPVVHRKMTHTLRMNLGSKSLGKILLELLLNGEEGGRCWRQLMPTDKGLYEVWLGNELVASMPCLRGGMGSDCDNSGATIPFTDGFAARTAAEYPLGTPYTNSLSNQIFLPFELLDFPAAAPVSFVIRSTNVTPASTAGAWDSRSYACNHSASATVAAPTTTTVQTLAAGHGASVRGKLDSLNLQGDPPGAYFYFGGNPTSTCYEVRMSMSTEGVSVPVGGEQCGITYPDGVSPALYAQNVLARQVAGIGRLIQGLPIEFSANGSTLVGNGVGFFNGGFSHTVTNTRHRWGHPGFIGGGRSGIVQPDPDYASYFSEFATTGRLDPSDPDFLDP